VSDPHLAEEGVLSAKNPGVAGESPPSEESPAEPRAGEAMVSNVAGRAVASDASAAPPEEIGLSEVRAPTGRDPGPVSGLTIGPADPLTVAWGRGAAWAGLTISPADPQTLAWAGRRR
jgi:hypothetical protein